MAARFAASLFPLLVTPRRAAPHVALGCTAPAKPVVVPRDEATALSRAALDNDARHGEAATTSVAAGPVGRAAQSSSDLSFLAEVLTDTRTSGFSVGLDFSGTALEPDEESSCAFYGNPRDFGALLCARPEPPAAASDFADKVQRAFPTRPATP